VVSGALRGRFHLDQALVPSVFFLIYAGFLSGAIYDAKDGKT
jgi:hypothetical protein